MRPEDAIRFDHMIEASESALRFIAGRNRADLDSDTVLAFALARALEIVGEAASKVAPDTRAKFPSVPWAAMLGMRNRLVHAYHDINLGLLWNTATGDLPQLLPHLRAARKGDAEPR